QEVGAHDRHGATIDLDHEVATGAAGEHETERKIGNDSDLLQHALVRDFRPQGKWIASIEGLIGERGDQLVRVDQLLVSAPHGYLQGDIEIDDRQLVLDEGTPGAAVVAAPLDIGEINAVAFDQEAGAAV